MMKGSYLILINLSEEQIITLGKKQNIYFPVGSYAYVGSAVGGFKSRLNRHLQGSRKPHWHIDYLLQRASISSIILCETQERVECIIAQALGSQFSSVPGFGSGDCQCRSHLFVAAEGRKMESTIMATLHQLAIQPKLAKYI